MSDDDNQLPEPQKAQESLESAALKKAGYNRTVFKAKAFIKQSVEGIVKGALIGGAVLGGGLVIGTLMTGGVPLIMGAIAASWIPKVGTAIAGVASNSVLGFAMTGALWGGAIGGLVKGGMGMSNLDEMADDEEARLVAKFVRAEQMEINNKQMKVNQEIAMANAKASMKGAPTVAANMSPTFTPKTNMQMPPNQGQQVG